MLDKALDIIRNCSTHRKQINILFQHTINEIYSQLPRKKPVIIVYTTYYRKRVYYIKNKELYFQIYDINGASTSTKVLEYEQKLDFLFICFMLQDTRYMEYNTKKEIPINLYKYQLNFLKKGIKV